MFTRSFSHLGLDESVKIMQSMGGWCRGQKVDISKREDVYKAAAEIKNNYGDVSRNSLLVNRKAGRVDMQSLEAQSGFAITMEEILLHVWK